MSFGKARRFDDKGLEIGPSPADYIISLPLEKGFSMPKSPRFQDTSDKDFHANICSRFCRRFHLDNDMSWIKDFNVNNGNGNLRKHGKFDGNRSLPNENHRSKLAEKLNKSASGDFAVNGKTAQNFCMHGDTDFENIEKNQSTCSENPKTSSVEDANSKTRNILNINGNSESSDVEGNQSVTLKSCPSFYFEDTRPEAEQIFKILKDADSSAVNKDSVVLKRQQTFIIDDVNLERKQNLKSNEDMLEENQQVTLDTKKMCDIKNTYPKTEKILAINSEGADVKKSKSAPIRRWKSLYCKNITFDANENLKMNGHSNSSDVDSISPRTKQKFENEADSHDIKKKQVTFKEQNSDNIKNNDAEAERNLDVKLTEENKTSNEKNLFKEKLKVDVSINVLNQDVDSPPHQRNIEDCKIYHSTPQPSKPNHNNDKFILSERIEEIVKTAVCKEFESVQNKWLLFGQNRVLQTITDIYEAIMKLQKKNNIDTVCEQLVKTLYEILDSATNEYSSDEELEFLSEGIKDKLATEDVGSIFNKMEQYLQEIRDMCHESQEQISTLSQKSIETSQQLATHDTILNNLRQGIHDLKISFTKSYSF